MAPKVIGVTLFYWGVSIALVLFNRVILVRFPFPLLLTEFQLIMSLILLLGASRVTNFAITTTVPRMKAMMPLVGVFLGMLATNNICLRYVDVTFYQVVRSLTIIFSIVFTRLMLPECAKQLTLEVVGCCAIVFVGFLGATIGELSESFAVSFPGVFFGVLSSVFVALFGIYQKKSLPIVDNDEWVLLWYNSLLSAFAMIPFVILELVVVQAPLAPSATLGVIVVISGLLGFLISIAGFMSVKITTPLTHTISTTVKACLQTILAVILLGERMGVLTMIGICTTIVGSIWYTQLKAVA